MAQAQIIAKVSSLSGEAFARDSAGNLRRLKAGDAIREGESVVAGDGAMVLLKLADGRDMTVQSGEVAKLDAEVAAPVKPDANDSAIVNNEKGFQKIAKALTAGGDLDELLEDPAAGLAGPGGNEGHTFIEFARIVEAVDPLAFSFASGGTRVVEVIDGAPLISGATNTLSTTGTTTSGATTTPPSAANDSNSVTEDGTPVVNGNVLVNDTLGVPNATPVTAATTALSYGTLVLNSDGSYTYTLNNANPAVNALKNGDTLTDSYTYTLTDGDGTSTTATLTITINGHTDGTPLLNIPDNNLPGQGDGDKTVAETDGAIPGEFTISAPAGLASLTVGTTVVTASQLGNLGTTPISINTGEGTLKLTGYDATTGKVSYTYDPEVQNHNGTVTDAIPLVVTDTLGQNTSDSLDIQITDSVPVAVNDNNSVTEDGTASITGSVLSNDTVGADTNATPVTAATTALSYGTLVLNSDGSYTYTLNNANPAVNALKNGDTLTDSYTYTLTDGDGTSTTATLTITINGHTDGTPLLNIPDNNLPGQGDGDKTVAETDGAIPGEFTISAPAGLASLTVGTTVVTASQLGNLGTTPISINTGEGTLKLTGYDATTGKVSYTYDPEVQNHNGTVTDAIPLVVTDTLGQNTSDSLDIQITDSVPVAVNDNNSVTEDGTASITGSVLSNDTVGADTNATPVTAATTALSYGTLVLNSDGSYTYTLNNANPAVNALKNGDTLTDSYTYTLTDGDGTSTTATLTITINGHTDGTPLLNIPDNNLPGQGDGDKTVAETDGAIPGEFTISAPAGLASLTVGTTVVTASQLGNLGTTPISINTGEGTLKLTGYDATTGKVSYTYDPEVQNHNGTVTDAIPLVVTDTLGQNTSDSLDIQITDSVPVAVNDNNSVTEDGTASITGSVLSNDTVGADTNATPVTAATTALSYGTLVLNSDGSYTYTLNNANPAVNALKNGDTLTDSYTYTLTDGDGTSTTATLTITINGHTDGTPLLNIPDNNLPGQGDGDKTVAETDGAIPGEFTISAPAGLASLTVGTTVVTASQLGNLGTTPISINTGEGTLKLTGYDATTGKVSYTYDPEVQNHNGTVTDAIPLVVTDTLGQNTSDSLDIQITDSVPVAVNDNNSVTEDGTASITGSVLSNDTVGADTNATPVTAATTALSYGTLVLNSDGSYTYTLNNANPAVNALKNGDTLTDSYTYTLTDGDGTSTTATLTITINGHTDGTPLLNIPDNNLPGQGDGDKTVAETDGAIPGEFTISAPAGLASLTVGTTVVTASQLGNLGTTPISINTGEGTLKLTGYDATTGKVSYTYDPEVQNHNGTVTDAIPLVVTDTLGQNTSDSLDIQITDSVPVAVNDNNSVTEDGTASITGSVLSNDTVGADTNATPVTAATTALSYGTLVLNSDGSYTYTLNNANPAVNALKNGDTLTDSYTYTLTDGDGTSTTATLTITINGHTDGTPLLNIPDNNLPGQGDGDKTVAETDGAIPGEFTISAPAGLASLTVGTTVVTASQLGNLGTTPISINTGEGTLKLTGYDATTGKVSYTYDPEVQNHNGTVTDAIPLVVTDTLGQNTSDSLDIQITDSVPVAVNDNNSVTEDGTASITGSVLSNDTVGADTNATPVTAATTALSYGTLVLNSDGSYTYTLNNANPAVNALKNGDTLTDSYTYTLTDGDGTSTTATLTITINGHTDGTPLLNIPDNNLPGQGDGDKTVAETDGAIPGEFTISAPAGLASLTVGTTVVTASQLGNLGTTPISINTGEGTLKLTGYDATTGKVSYTYDPEVQNHNGTVTDAIPLVVTDTLGQNTSDSLDIQITDSVPVAVNDNNSVTEDGTASITGSVLSNDTVGADSNATPVTAATTALSYGTLVLNSDGSYTYTLNNANPAVNALKNGDTLTDSYTYTLTDGDGTSTTATLTITINGHTDGTPSITPVDGNGSATGQASVNEMGLLTVANTSETTTGSITVSAPDGLASITVGGTTVTASQLAALGTTPISINTGEGTLTLTGYDAGTGALSYSYTLLAAQSQPGATESIDTIALNVLDAGGTSSTGTLSIQIVDSTPTAVSDKASITEDASPNTVSGNVLGNDTVGADANATPVTAASQALTYGTLVLNANGSYTYTLNNANPAVNALKTGQSLTDSYTYTITDGDGDTTTATLTITINGHTDGTPSITPVDGNGAVNGQATVDEVGLLTVANTSETTTGTITVSAPDGLASITVDGTTVTATQLANLGTTPISINTGEGQLTLTGYNAGTGVLSYSYTLLAAQNQPGGTSGSDSIALSVLDAGGGTSNGVLTVHILDSAPTAVADLNSVTEDTQLSASGNVLGNDTLSADATSLTGVSAGTHTTLAIGGGVGTTVGSYGTLILNADGSYVYNLNNSNSTVNGLKTGQSINDVFSYTIQDADGDWSTQTLTITINGHTDGTPSITPVDGNGAAAGQATVNEIGLISSSDNSESTTGTITVSAPDGLASITVDGTVVTAAQLAALGSTPISINTGEGQLTLTGYNAGTGALSYSYTLSAAQTQTGATESLDNISLVVTDQGGGSNTGTLGIRIVDSTPSAVNDSASITEDASPNTVSGSVLANDTVGADTNATPVTAANTALTYGTLVLNANGSYTYTLNNANPAVNALKTGQSLTDSYTYTITDGDGDTTTATLTITINGHTDGTPSITPVDGNGAAAGQATVNEIGLISSSDNSESTTGTITVSAPDGLASITVDGTVVTAAQLAALGSTPISINTGEGQLTLTGYNAGTGALSYSYTLSAAQTQTGATESLDNISLVVTDQGGGSNTGTLGIRIVDSTPSAVNDSASITEDASPNTVSGSVLANDTVGADTNATPVTAANTALTYGTLVLNANGSYTYTLNNANPAVNALKTGQSLTDSYTYTITDGDGDTTTATLTITINGSNDAPVITVPAVQSTPEDTAKVFSTANGNAITIGDVDSASVTTTLSVQHGSLTLGSTAGVTVTGNGTGSVQLVGSPAAITAALNGLTYANTADYNGSDTLSISTSDGAAPTVVSSIALNVTPVVDIANDSATTAEDTLVNIKVNANDSFENAGHTITAINGTAISIGGTVNVAHGTVTLKADGTLDYQPASNYNGTDQFTYTVTSGGVTETATANVTITPVNDAPVVGSGTATVSEEGLTNGLVDTTGNPSDTTNATTATGTISIVDIDSSPTVTLTAPTSTLTSGGVALSWSGSGTSASPLVATAGGVEVFRATIDNNGNYTVTLSKAIDHATGNGENIKSFNIGVSANDGTTTTVGALTVNVEDDSPVAVASTKSVALPYTDTNLLITLDISGSMDTADGPGGLTRLQTAKNAINQLLDQYDALGDVKVELVTFSTSASQASTVWMTVAEARTAINALTANGGTNYDAALATAETAFTAAGKIAGANNVAYFFTDGVPTYGAGDATTLTGARNGNGSDPNSDPDVGIQSAEQTNWQNFLNSNSILSHAIGLGTGVTTTYLEPIAFNGTNNSENPALLVSDLSQLTTVLRDTVVPPSVGDLLTGGVITSGAGLGADGGYIQSLVVNGTTYTYNPASGGSVAVTGTNHAVFDTTNNQLIISTTLGGKLVVNLDTGAYTYTAPVTITSAQAESIAYTLVDMDGDTAGSTLTINVTPPQTVTLTSSTTSITGLNMGLSGEYYGYNDNRDGTAADTTYQGTTAVRLHSDDGTADAGTANNVDRLADVEAIIEGRNNNANLINNAVLADPTKADATFSANKLEFGLPSGSTSPLFSNDLGQNGKVTSGAIGASATVGGTNNLYSFLKVSSGNADGLAATSGLGDTTDAIIRMVGYIYIPAGGVYDLRVTADDGYRVLIGGQNIGQADYIQSTATQIYSGVTLSEGLQPIEILYWDQGGHASLRVELKTTGAADSTYSIIGNDNYALFSPTDVPTLGANQDIVESTTTNGLWEVRTGQNYTGTSSAEKIVGSDGIDTINAGDGNDVVQAGAGSDLIYGGAGNDVLTGGLGSDTFAWKFADQGTSTTPARDTITDFSVASKAAGGDILDLRDLLQGENHTTGTGNLSAYLHFSKSGSDTVIDVTPTGSGGSVTQKITLTGVDLTANNTLNDQAIIQDLLTKGKLVTD